MGFGKFLKKNLGQLATPLFFLGPAVHLIGSAGEVISDNVQNNRREGTRERVAGEKAKEDEQNAFLEQLDGERRRNKKSNVIFAGMLGDQKSVGLGGQKSLLGL